VLTFFKNPDFRCTACRTCDTAIRNPCTGTGTTDTVTCAPLTCERGYINIGGVCYRDLCTNPGCGFTVDGITCRQENGEAFFCTCPGVVAIRVPAGSEFGGCERRTGDVVPTTTDRVRDVPPERVEAKVLERVDAVTDVKVVEKTENRIVLDVTTDREIDEATERELREAVVDALDLREPDAADRVHLDIEQTKKRLFSSTVTATIDDETGGAFAVTGLVSILVAILAALF